MQIFVKYDRTYLLNVTRSLRISSLMNMMRAKMQLSSDVYIQLSYAGKILHPDRYLGDYCIMRESTLSMHLYSKEDSEASSQRI